MRILITGGAGTLGSSLIEKYLPEGHEICVIDNFATGKRAVLPNVDGLRIIEGSIQDESLVKNAFQDFKPTHVVNSAASYKDLTNWAEDTNTNVLGAINVAKAALSAGVEKFINFQTALCYGRTTVVPIPANHPVGPFTSYGISKTAGEAYLLQSELPVVSLRLSNICGPRLAIGPIPTFYTRLKEGKSCFCSDSVRDFLDLSDFTALMDIIMSPGTSVTGVFNVSTGEGHSIKDVFDEVCVHLGIEVPEVPIVPIGEDDVKEVVLDPEKTELSFGWKAKVNFRDTIKKQLNWYDEFGVNDIYSHLTSGSK